MARIVGIVCSTGSWRIGRYRCRRYRPVNCLNRLPHHLVGSLIQILLVHSGQLCAFGEMAGDIESSESFDGRQQVVAHPRAQRIVVRQLAVYRIAIGGVIPIFHTQVFTEAGGFVSSKGQQRPRKSHATACEDLRHAGQRIHATAAQQSDQYGFRLIVHSVGQQHGNGT